MRIVQHGILPVILAAVLAGCTTFRLPADSPVGDMSNKPASEESALSTIYRELTNTPDGRTAAIAFPDGFGSSGVTVIRRYFSASGKRCIKVAEIGSGELRTLCQNDDGATNAFSSPGNIEPL